MNGKSFGLPTSFPDGRRTRIGSVTKLCEAEIQDFVKQVSRYWTALMRFKHLRKTCLEDRALP